MVDDHSAPPASSKVTYVVAPDGSLAPRDPPVPRDDSPLLGWGRPSADEDRLAATGSSHPGEYPSPTYRDDDDEGGYSGRHSTDSAVPGGRQNFPFLAIDTLTPSMESSAVDRSGTTSAGSPKGVPSWTVCIETNLN
ncbi:hypothetical protein M407DRAFT_28827 [Tulasnella calospora MUT 4182]|uniref:Uncharacterized protein n=1 Tax=Tulasnella calospora MUT 4182 TaxID=1051891 RepID=A0A0C3QBB3_9AGAM|nr:hypothetical protein M407DRAFT_28827 [Tulasnella calospora MUT 4182]